MPLELLPIHESHIRDLARICHEAFSSLQSRHNIPLDVPDLDTGELIISAVARRPDYFGVTAILDGVVVGSNFLQHSDEVAGVGPITVDPSLQSRGIGRALMQHIISEARRRNIRQTRLFQEAVNTTSLSLYTSLGFHWRDSAALMQITPAKSDDPTIRPMTPRDLPMVESLSRMTYGSSRAGDAKQLLAANLPGFMRERNARSVGYLIPTLFGHAGAVSDEDLLALAAHAARKLPPPMSRILAPLSRPDLFRRALAAGHRTLKLFNYMSLGDYTPPKGAWLPSIQC